VYLENAMNLFLQVFRNSLLSKEYESAEKTFLSGVFFKK
jgi:hypothetical protein